MDPTGALSDLWSCRQRRLTTPERQLGSWRLGEELGRGGNGKVWKVENVETGAFAALKELNTSKVDREPYKRFITEIEALRGLGEYSGVLPLLDAHVPEKPGPKKRPWFVMPVATPITAALSNADHAAIVESFASIARTLASLRADYEMGHRDMKPANLFELNGVASIGDFGLVSLPDRRGLTELGKPLGPTNFIPFEMLNEPADADPLAADVYSLAKSFWVLATGVDYPPPGHQPAGAEPYRIADYRPHPNAVRLDELVDRCTRLEPRSRPEVAEVAQELQTWLELPVAKADFDLASVSGAVRERLSAEIGESERVDEWKEDAYRASRRLEELIQPLNEAMKAADPRAKVGVTDELVDKMLATLREFGAAEVLYHFTRATTISAGSDPIAYVLRMGRGVELVEDGQLVIRTMIDLGLDGVMQSDMHWMSKERAVPVGSVQQRPRCRRRSRSWATSYARH
ncbi:MAG: hypothetical protein QOF85_1615 [Solirubrobacterales bacterium]|nr:hypothetical protein [Solirubrobacterales bacterium]